MGNTLTLSRKHTSRRVEALKQDSQDFEWYPTTQEIIDAVASDIIGRGYRMHSHSVKVLDVGAGDGRVLLAIDKALRGNNENYSWLIAEMFAIEKATAHLSNLPKEIVVIGTDFMEQMLVDKRMDYVFCNPPYSEYEVWANKLIREASAHELYLVIPQRWVSSDSIKQSLKSRDAEVESLGEFDFEDADRQARAKVELLRVSFGFESDPFRAAVESMMPELEHFEDGLDTPNDATDAELITADGGLIAHLVKSYNASVARMVTNYRTVATLDAGILSELGVSKQGILDAIKLKVTGLKDAYWARLFARFTSITKRLATKQRREFLESLKGKSTIDFTESNIYSMLIWVTKWSNGHFDDQLTQLFRTLSELCNVTKYTSNRKVWSESRWRYNDEARSHYKLERRIVLDRVGGICTSTYAFECFNGLRESAFTFIQDCITVANNLGFDCDDTPANYQWGPNKQITIKLNSGEDLVAIRAFKNGNLHMHFNSKVMLAINVEAGRLLGWIRSAEEAVSELAVEGDEAEFVTAAFGSSYHIAASNAPRILNGDTSNGRT